MSDAYYVCIMIEVKKISIPFSFFTAFINSSEPTKWFSIQEFHLRSVNFQKFLLSKMKFVQQDNYLHIVLAHTVELGKLLKKKQAGIDYFIILTYFLVKKQGSIGLYSTEGKEAKNKERGSTKMVYSILMKNCHFLPKWVFFVHHLPQLAKFLADNASRRIDANTMMIDAFNREGFIKIKASLCQLTNNHLKIG